MSLSDDLLRALAAALESHDIEKAPEDVYPILIDPRDGDFFGIPGTDTRFKYADGSPMRVGDVVTFRHDHSKNKGNCDGQIGMTAIVSNRLTEGPLGFGGREEIEGNMANTEFRLFMPYNEVPHAWIVHCGTNPLAYLREPLNKEEDEYGE
jgi:hypothetical protein